NPAIAPLMARHVDQVKKCPDSTSLLRDWLIPLIPNTTLIHNGNSSTESKPPITKEAGVVRQISNPIFNIIGTALLFAGKWDEIERNRNASAMPITAPVANATSKLVTTSCANLE